MGGTCAENGPTKLSPWTPRDHPARGRASGLGFRAKTFSDRGRFIRVGILFQMHFFAMMSEEFA